MKPGVVEQVRDFACQELTFTAPYAAYFTGLSVGLVRTAVTELEHRGILEIIEPARRGRLGGPAVYGYVEIEKFPVARPKHQDHIPADLAAQRGRAQPFTGRVSGGSGKPGVDRKKQERGHRVKKAKSTGRRR